MSTTIPFPKRPKIKYPDSDGKPMSEHDLQYKWIVVIKEGVEGQFTTEPNVYVAGDLLWYAVEGNPKIRGAPDVLVAFGRPKGLRGSYKQWEEGGIAPQVVFEVRSPGNRAGELRRKFEFYERYRVEEYYLYNPFNGDLDGWRRWRGGLKKIAQMRGFVSPRLEIRFEPGKGADNLTIISRNGERFLTYQEMRAQRDTEHLHAENAELRAKNAELRAENAELRAERYAARLRELGIESD